MKRPFSFTFCHVNCHVKSCCSGHRRLSSLVLGNFSASEHRCDTEKRGFAWDGRTKMNGSFVPFRLYRLYFQSHVLCRINSQFALIFLIFLSQIYKNFSQLQESNRKKCMNCFRSCVFSHSRRANDPETCNWQHQFGCFASNQELMVILMRSSGKSLVFTARSTFGNLQEGQR